MPRWFAVSSLTNDRTFENQLHAAGAQLTLVIEHTAVSNHILIIN